ncbi:hypothetical protein BTZ20_2540 [Rhodococcus sp. MTM3W5.2]|nr:hypothetical protein BTZ20_2540 [Rhodococcus sp. MTM3W5.2]
MLRHRGLHTGADEGRHAGVGGHLPPHGSGRAGHALGHETGPEDDAVRQRVAAGDAVGERSWAARGVVEGTGGIDGGRRGGRGGGASETSHREAACEGGAAQERAAGGAARGGGGDRGLVAHPATLAHLGACAVGIR